MSAFQTVLALIRAYIIRKLAEQVLTDIAAADALTSEDEAIIDQALADYADETG